MNTYILIHDHKHGVDTYLLQSERRLSTEDKAVQDVVDFDPNGWESLDLQPINQPVTIK